MALKPCRECKKKVSTEAVNCPNCGVPEPTKKINPKADSNEFEEIWLYAKPGYDSLKATYNYVTSQIDKDSAYRIFNITSYFERGIFEASCEHFKLDKSLFKKAVVYCFRRTWDNDTYESFSNEKKNRLSKETYQSTEDGLRYDDSIGKMCAMIINKGKNSFKENGAGCFADATKLWKDKSINFTDSPIKRDVKSFFKKLF
jgi:RNA polymerase subunit RPABC4/transcription elongation factor Spt4